MHRSADTEIVVSSIRMALNEISKDTTKQTNIFSRELDSFLPAPEEEHSQDEDETVEDLTFGKGKRRVGSPKSSSLMKKATVVSKSGSIRRMEEFESGMDSLYQGAPCDDNKAQVYPGSPSSTSAPNASTIHSPSSCSSSSSNGSASTGADHMY